mgnify:CR=1 FL=1
MLITVENQFNIRNNTLENLIKEEEIVIAKAKNFGEYALLFSKINLNTRQKNKAKTQQDLKAIAAFLNSPLLKNEKLILSNKALIIYRHCRSILFCRCQDNESRETECQLLLELMDAHPNLIEEMPNRYITTLNNLINIAFEEHKFKTCPTFITNFVSFFRLLRCVIQAHTRYCTCSNYFCQFIMKV